jgi:hypothetical protein
MLGGGYRHADDGSVGDAAVAFGRNSGAVDDEEAPLHRRRQIVQVCHFRVDVRHLNVP